MKSRNLTEWAFLAIALSFDCYGGARLPLHVDSHGVMVESAAGDGASPGNWREVRAQLAEDGVRPRLMYIGEVFSNVSGGRQTGTVYEGVAELSVDLDIERLTRGAWVRSQLHVSTLWTHGPSPSARLTGDSLGASNIDAYDSLRLYELWHEQFLFEERLSLRIGSLLADAEFAGTDYGGVLLNGAFGWPAYISANVLNSGPAYPVPALGMRIRWKNGDSWYAQTGVFDGDSFDSRSGDPHVNANGLHWQLNSQQGMFAIAELGLLKNHDTNARGLPGSVKFGAWRHSADFADNYRDTSGGSYIVSGLPAAPHAFNLGAYLAVEKMVWSKAGSLSERKQTIGLFGRLGASPRDRSVYEWVASGGVHFRGLLAGREQDTFAVGLVFAQVSRDLRRRQRDDRDVNGTPYTALADHESVLEIAYSCQVKPWLVVKPDIQWIHHPGGSRATPDALLFGLRSRFAF